MVQVSEIFFADKPYNPAVSYSSDIALIKLKSSITISQYVLPACFRNDNRNGFNPGLGTLGVVKKLYTIPKIFVSDHDCIIKYCISVL